MTQTIVQEDNQWILSKLDQSWSQFKNSSILLTGGTGFIGKSLLEAFVFAHIQLKLNLSIYVLSRNPKIFLNKHAQFQKPFIHWIQGDIQNFTDQLPSRINFIIHGATDVSIQQEHSKLRDSITLGTSHLLDWASTQPNCRILNLSSGAVYGNSTSPQGLIEKDGNTVNNISKNDTYALAKQEAEQLCQHYVQEKNMSIKTARIFTLIGPYITSHRHLAITDFISKAFHQQQILIQGDGQNLRSYLYTADLTVWLLTILLHGSPGCTYNVGSPHGVSIATLAEKCSKITSPPLNPPQILNAHKASHHYHYLPDVSSIQQDLNVNIHYNLDKSIQRTWAWYQEVKTTPATD